ncbi:uncharacterized protein LOC110835157 isoform X3 [Zootermopsis nevadensis]|uniref:uncharacterized protein LOC110835157 isoform X3 n=1 Tax=Zootermopsis nevadensis TaxID=136037 RepID=UPI000B8E3F2B|nr:uncharacterized protein LOC110835157 isoform X3 [Zootermopsis nevadensis]
MCDERDSYVQIMLQSPAKRVPKIVLHRAEEIFPSLKGTSNIDKIKIENEVDVLSEEDSVCVRNDEVSTPSAFPIIKDEWKNCMDLVKDEPDSDSDMCQDGNQVIGVKAEDVSDIKIEEHPIPITNLVMKDEQEMNSEHCVSFRSLYPFHVK